MRESYQHPNGSTVWTPKGPKWFAVAIYNGAGEPLNIDRRVQADAAPTTEDRARMGSGLVEHELLERIV